MWYEATYEIIGSMPIYYSDFFGEEWWREYITLVDGPEAAKEYFGDEE